MSKFLTFLGLIGGIALCSSQTLSATCSGAQANFKQDEPSSIGISGLHDFNGLDN